MQIILAITAMLLMAILFAIVLSAADKKFKVEEDELTRKIGKILPGLNCGGCGYPNCAAYAKALKEGKAEYNSCRAGGAEVREQLAVLLGLDKDHIVHVQEIAVVRCCSTETTRKKDIKYTGTKSCSAASLLAHSITNCRFGCFGFGDCKLSCKFDAIEIIDGLPVINQAKCVSCGACVKTCPRGLIVLEKIANLRLAYIACSSKDKGSIVRKACSVGCIGCGICQKIEARVFEIKDNLAVINYNKADTTIPWEKAINSCPVKVIKKI